MAECFGMSGNFSFYIGCIYVAVFAGIVGISTVFYRKKRFEKYGYVYKKLGCNIKNIPYFLKDCKKAAFVYENSEAVKNILELNKKYIPYLNFINEKNNYYYFCKSKRQFDTLNDYKIAKDIIINNIENLRYNISSAKANKLIYEDYLREVERLKTFKAPEQIKNIPLLKMDPLVFSLIEKEEVACAIISKPVTSIDFILNISYTSPKGRNHYSRKFLLIHDEVKGIISLIEENLASEHKIKSGNGAEETDDVLSKN